MKIYRVHNLWLLTKLTMRNNIVNERASFQQKVPVYSEYYCILFEATRHSADVDLIYTTYVLVSLDQMVHLQSQKFLSYLQF